jgi:hypothetical protein
MHASAYAAATRIVTPVYVYLLRVTCGTYSRGAYSDELE